MQTTPAPLILPSFPMIEARARNIKRTLGLRRAAAYLCEQGVGEEVARRILVSPDPTTEDQAIVLYDRSPGPAPH
jgi:hypothetical protein